MKSDFGPGGAVDLRDGLSGAPVGQTNLFWSLEWRGAVDNKVILAAIEELEKRIALVGVLDELSPLEKFGARVLIMQYEMMTGRSVGDVLSGFRGDVGGKHD